MWRIPGWRTTRGLTDMELRTSLESAQGLFIAEGTKVIGRAVAAG